MNDTGNLRGYGADRRCSTFSQMTIFFLEDNLLMVLRNYN